MSALSEQCEVLRLWAKQLRESEPILASDLREAADTISNLWDTEQQAQSENAKLRELAHDMWRLLLATGNDDLVLSLEVNGVVKEVIDAEELAKTMRELGVGVDK